MFPTLSTLSRNSVEAGLPEIYAHVGGFGKWAGRNWGINMTECITGGAFALWMGAHAKVDVYAGVLTSDQGYDTVNFFASRSNSIYNKSNTVTPMSQSTLWCIKY